MSSEQHIVLRDPVIITAPRPTGFELLIETTSAVLANLVVIFLRLGEILWTYVILTSYIWINGILLVATAVFTHVPLYAYIIGALFCVAKVSYEGFRDAIHRHQGAFYTSNVVTDITIAGFLAVAIGMTFAIKQKFTNG